MKDNNTKVPDFISKAQVVPLSKRIPWYKGAGPTYFGVMLWFVVWQDVVKGDGSPGGLLATGIGPALLVLLIVSVGCHVLFYLVPGLLGMRSGLPLYTVGTSTFGARGGQLVPGMMMGILQFGWLAVNGSAVALLLCECFGLRNTMPSVGHGLMAAGYVMLAGFIGYRGIGAVAKVATYLPLIPVLILLVLLSKTIGGIGSFSTVMTRDVYDGGMVITGSGTMELAVLAMAGTYVFGFFSQAGAVAVDFGMHNRNARDIHMGGLVGGSAGILFGCGLATLIVAGAYGAGLVSTGNQGSLNPVMLMRDILGKEMANLLMILLAVSCFPAACCAGFVASNCCRSILTSVKPAVSIGVGVAVAMLLAASGLTGRIVPIFTVVGAVFGPVVGAMVADYLLAGRRWVGPRSGFNPAGWISIILGFVVGVADFDLIPGLKGNVPCPPLAAYLVGMVSYFVLSKLGLQTQLLKIPKGDKS